MMMWSKPPSVSEVPVRLSRFLVPLAAAAVLVAPWAVSAAPPAEPKDVGELVAAVQQTYGGITAMRADFMQTSKNAMTGAEEKVHGHIALERPRKYRIEQGVPASVVIVGDGTTQWLFQAAQKQVIVQKQLGDGGMAGLVDNLGHLGELFDATLAPPTTPPKPVFQLKLVPKTPGAAKQLDLTIKKGNYLLQELDVTDATGGLTQMNFTGVILGGDVPDAQFTFKAPPGVSVVQL